MALNIRKRWEIVFLNQHEQGPKWSEKRIGKYLNISKTTVKKWLNRFKETGVQDLKGRGRPKILNSEIEKQLFDMFKENEHLTLRDAKIKLRRFNVEASTSTISRTLKCLGFKYKTPIFKPLLNSTHIKKRLQFCRETIDIDWDDVIFSDETTFKCTRYKRKYWANSGAKKFISRVKHPPKIHVWGCFSSHGFGALYLFKDNLNAKKMIKIYKTVLMKSVRHFGFTNNNEWWLQEDNDSKHMANISKNWKSTNHVQRIPWPPNSLDPSPIENLWGIMKMDVQLFS